MLAWQLWLHQAKRWWWRSHVILYRLKVTGCPECRARGWHRWSCDYESRERDGRNWN